MQQRHHYECKWSYRGGVFNIEQGRQKGPHTVEGMRNSVVLRTITGAARAWWDDDCVRLGASLAFYTLFAIAPVLMVAITIAGFAFGAEAVRGEIVGQLDHLIGREGALAVQGLLEGAARRPAGFFGTLLGGITFLVAATGAFLELQIALNTIWRVKPKPGRYLHAFVIDRDRKSTRLNSS